MPRSAGAESALVVSNWIQYIFPVYELKVYSSLNSFSGCLSNSWLFIANRQEEAYFLY